MNSKSFKILFGDIAQKRNFKKAYGGWHIQSKECTTILELQKSNFGDYFQLLIKVYIQGAFGREYLPSKDLMKNPLGHLTITEPLDFKSVLDFDEFMDDEIRKARLVELFDMFIVPFTQATSNKAGIKDLSDQGKIFLLPAIKSQL